MNEKKSDSLKISGFSRQLWIAVVILTAVSVVLLAVSFFLLPGSSQGPAGQKSQADYSTYRYHIAVISDETDTTFWADVYRGGGGGRGRIRRLCGADRGRAGRPVLHGGCH